MIVRYTFRMFGLTPQEGAILRKLSTPIKIQDFLNTLPLNHEKRGDTHFSPRRVLNERKAHCIEGAMLAAAALWLQGEKPLLLDLTARRPDDDHVVALYKKNGYFGALSKTNHAVLRFRDPIYRTVRELALSYYHEYFLNADGRKTLESYSRPLNLATLGDRWVTDEEDVWYVAEALDTQPHYSFVPEANRRWIRRADLIERRSGQLIEWKKADRRT